MGLWKEVPERETWKGNERRKEEETEQREKTGNGELNVIPAQSFVLEYLTIIICSKQVYF